MPFTLGVVLLAAGRSTRMGRPKLLMNWGQTSIIGHLLTQWRALSASQLGVVCAEGDTVMAAELDRLGVFSNDCVFNPSPERGMFSSIQCAARWAGWKEGLTHWAIVLGDQPHLSPKTVEKVVQFSAAHPGNITVPRQGGHRRHPVLLPKLDFLKTANSNANDLREFLDRSPTPIAFCDLTDSALQLDIDRPEDYTKALRLFLPEN